MMKYRVLGKTGMRVSVVGVGTWQFGGEWGKTFEQAEVTAMFRRARELGINLIDTAECYGDHVSERFIGEALRELGARGDFLLATKFGHKFHQPFERTEPRTGPEVRQQLEDSLRALQTDYIDLYQYHSAGDAAFEREDVRAVLEQAKATGKVRHIGNSVSPNDKVHQIALSEKYGVESVQVVYNRLNRKPEGEVFPLCAKLGLGVLARVPLASGLLSGKYQPGTVFPENEVRGKWKPADQEAQLREVERIKREEVPAGANGEGGMAEWALAWCLKHPAVTCVIPGCKSVGQVESNARAAEFEFVRGV